MATAAQALTAADAARAEVDAYLDAAQRKSLLRFITCGSVDDGKSTLIGRLLFDSKMLFEDQLAALASDSRRIGTQGEALDFALLVDGLGAEREQGITIDVAYRFFATDKRKFIVADTPGHEQYTRNMVTGASTADLAVILVDARKGVLTQTRRHSFLVQLLGIRNVVLAVNKMDLVGYSRERFDEIVRDYRDFASEAGIAGFTPIPLSGLKGDNVTAPGDTMAWYDGPHLLAHLENVEIGARGGLAPFRMPVQWVNRPNSGFRGYAGRIASGLVRVGDPVLVLPSGQSAEVERIVTFDGDLDQAVAGQSVTLTFDHEIDCSRGNVIVSAGAPDRLADRLCADLVWMAEEALVPGRSYWLKSGTQTVSASVETIGHVVDVNSLERLAGRPLGLNDIGRCEIDLDRSLPALPYLDNRQLGSFILIDKVSHATVAAGMIVSAEQAAGGEHGQDAASNILWVTGASAAERSALAARTLGQLQALGRTAFVLDEAAVRGGLNSDLDPGDSAESVRRIREVALLMSAAGVQVIVALDVAPADAHPGRRIGEGEQAQPDDWVI